MTQEPAPPIPQAGGVATTRVLIADDDVTMCTFCARALSAVSEDRQWLVVLYEGEAMGWQIYQFRWDGFTFEPCCWEEDTGQDAHEVLAAWLEGLDVGGDWNRMSPKGSTWRSTTRCSRGSASRT